MKVTYEERLEAARMLLANANLVAGATRADRESAKAAARRLVEHADRMAAEKAEYEQRKDGFIAKARATKPQECRESNVVMSDTDPKGQK